MVIKEPTYRIKDGAQPEKTKRRFGPQPHSSFAYSVPHGEKWWNLVKGEGGVGGCVCPIGHVHCRGKRGGGGSQGVVGGGEGGRWWLC